MFTIIIEIASLVLFLGCFWHAARYQPSGFAAQWFVAAYVLAIFRETVMQVAFQMYFYSPNVLRIGAAPAMISFLWGAVFYLAYVFAQRIVPVKERFPFGALMFIITASLMLPIEATATQVGWWVYEDPAPLIFGRVPVTVPLIWGGAAVMFYVVFERIRSTRLPERGRTYAMITFAPIIAAAHILYTLALGFVLG